MHPDRTPDKTFELYSVPIFPTRKPEIIKGEEIRSNKQAVETGDVLLCKINPRINRVWKVSNFTDNENIASTEWIVVRQREITTEYLRYSLMAPYFRNLLQSNVSGVGGSLTRAKPREVRNYVLPIPPLSEQSRIAAKIAQLFALLRKVESSTQQYAQLQTLLKSKVLDLAMRGKLVEQDPHDEPASVLLEKIKAEKEQLVKEGKIKKSKPLPPIADDEKPFDIPDSWEWVRLGNLTAPVEYAMADGPFGSNLKKADYTLNPEVRIIQLSNIGDNGWKNNNVKYTTFEHLKAIQRSEVYPGNIVIAKMMPAGRAIIVPNNDKKYVLSSDAVKFIPNELLNKIFLLFCINSDVYRDQVNSKLQGTTRPRTSLKKLKSFILPIPPVKEQKRILIKLLLLRQDLI